MFKNAFLCIKFNAKMLRVEVTLISGTDITMQIFHFILSYFNTKPHQLKRAKKNYTYIYLHITKPYKFVGLPRDRASRRMLVFQEFLQFPFENGNRGTHSDF